MRDLSLCLGLTVGILNLWTPTADAEGNFMSNHGQVDWITVGLGAGTSGGSKGISYSYPAGKDLISLRFVHNFSDIYPSPYSFKSVWDAGVLYGRIAKSSNAFASVSAGMSMVGGVRGSGREYGRVSYWNGFSFASYSANPSEERFLSVGIPVQVQLFWSLLSHIGVGINGFANLNPEESFAGALLGVQIGTFR